MCPVTEEGRVPFPPKQRLESFYWKSNVPGFFNPAKQMPALALTAPVAGIVSDWGTCEGSQPLTNLLLDLPAELRIAIYELAVGNGSPPTNHTLLAAWRTPALAQVNRQIRNEVIPIYYGREEGFKVLLLYEPDRPLSWVRLFCEHYSQYLQYVKHLDVNVQHYRSILAPTPMRAVRVELYFKMIYSSSCAADGKTGLRIGNDDTNWDDNKAAVQAFEEWHTVSGLEASVNMRALRSCPTFCSDLRLLAKHAKLANRWIQLSYTDRRTLRPTKNDPNNYFNIAFRAISPEEPLMCHI
ncbi:hypothetical protein NUW58_g6346 [Xylaria curta]|uniref:Uncharacterized protein n=1 Tax=Xylaria curta TaxID=42375 RepID=A0ACC1NU99_9PEZI|nr:hypothetical protein NUW58_g6346 [Xylaria curta]